MTAHPSPVWLQTLQRNYPLQISKTKPNKPNWVKAFYINWIASFFSKQTQLAYLALYQHFAEIFGLFFAYLEWARICSQVPLLKISFRIINMTLDRGVSLRFRKNSARAVVCLGVALLASTRSSAQTPSPALVVLEKSEDAFALVDPASLQVIARVPVVPHPRRPLPGQAPAAATKELSP